MPSAPFYSNVFLPRGPSSLLLKKTKKITFLITFYQRGDLATTERETKTLFTWSGGPRSSGVRFFCFVSPRTWKQKKTNPTRPGSPTPCKQALNFRTRHLFQQPMIRVSSDSIKTKTFFESSFNIHLSTIKQITILLLCNVIQIISYIAYCLNFFERKNISKKRNSETVG